MPDPGGDLLDLPAKRGRLHALAAVGVLSRAELEQGLREIGHRPSEGSWSTYLYRQTLLVGVALLAAGTIFFVAANWSALTGFTRMGIVAGAMVLATLVGGYLGETLAGRAMTLLGGLLFGPLVAVYGQIYQTGADAWELFAVWTVVLIAYGVLARFVGTWALALLGLHITCFTWIDQELGESFTQGAGALIVAALALVDALIVGLSERFTRGLERQVIAHTAAFFGLCIVLPFGVLAILGELPEGGALGVVVLLAALIAIWLIYRSRRPDLSMLAAFACVVTILISTFFARLLFETDAELFGVVALGVVICAQVWGFTRWLLAWRREHGPPSDPKREHPGQDPEQGAGAP